RGVPRVAGAGRPPLRRPRPDRAMAARAEPEARGASVTRGLPARSAAGRGMRNPVDRLTHNLPRGWRIAIDWVVTIVGAVAIVFAIKAWVINPYRIPSSSMEPTLHCARPGSGCEARFSDRVL